MTIQDSFSLAFYLTEEKQFNSNTANNIYKTEVFGNEVLSCLLPNHVVLIIREVSTKLTFKMV